MKNVTYGRNMVTKMLSLFTLLLITTFAHAQDKAVDINVDLNKGGNWYANPIVWVIGAAVFILLLVALLRGDKKV